MKKSLSIIAILAFATFSVAQAAVDLGVLSKKKISSAGLYLTANDAYEMKKEMGKNALFVDIRTHGEIYSPRLIHQTVISTADSHIFSSTTQ